MIYDKLSNLESYRGLSPRLLAGLKALAETDFSKIEDGHYELEGEDLYMNVMTAELKETNERPEAHRKYIDIQYVFEGEEDIGVAFLDEMGAPIEENPEKDIWFFAGETVKLRLGGDRFIVLFPQDAHAPCISVNHGTKSRKAVVKVLV